MPFGTGDKLRKHKFSEDRNGRNRKRTKRKNNNVKKRKTTKV